MKTSLVINLGANKKYHVVPYNPLVGLGNIILVNIKANDALGNLIVHLYFFTEVVMSCRTNVKLGLISSLQQLKNCIMKQVSGNSLRYQNLV